MTKLTDDEVRHIAKLARLRLSDAEVKKMGPELTAILAYVEKLQAVDTKGIEATAQVTGLTNAWRDDVLTQGNGAPDDLLDCSPLAIIDRQIETRSSHG